MTLFPQIETPPSMTKAFEEHARAIEAAAAVWAAKHARTIEAAGPLFDMPALFGLNEAEAGAGADHKNAPHNDEGNPKQ